MKLTIYLTCMLAANAAVLKSSTLEKRQGIGVSYSDSNNPLYLYAAHQIAKKTPLKPVVSQALKAELFTQASRERLIFGPFQLQPVEGEHKTGEGGYRLDPHGDLFEEALGGICRNCMILALHYDVTDMTGKKLLPKDEVYTHHMVLGSNVRGKPMNPLSVTRHCPNGSDGSAPLPDPNKFPDFYVNPPVIILNKGQEKTAINFASLDKNQPQSGFWIGKNDTIMTSVEIVNYKATTTQDVYLTLDLEYLSFDIRPNTYLRTEFARVREIRCAGIRAPPPSDRLVTYETPQHRVQKNLYLVDLHPHLHDGALDMKVHINGTVVCRAEAIYGREGGMRMSGQEEWETISHYTRCNTTKLYPGDQLKITADYDLRRHKLRPDSADHHMDSDVMTIGFIQFASAD